MLIKDIPEDERPREKLFRNGAASLSDAEILALFFATGRAGTSAIELGREMINRFGSLRNMSRATTAELCQIPGIGPAKAAQLAAVFEFGRRLAHEPFNELSVASPEDVFSLIGPEMQMLAQESVRVILLNHRKRLIHLGEVFRGTGNESFANPSEILRKAISLGAHAFVVVHNHPSGDPTPSQADIAMTERIRTGCEALSITLHDHLIIGKSRESSFRSLGLI
jgi:DNA repair protein RadC